MHSPRIAERRCSTVPTVTPLSSPMTVHRVRFLTDLTSAGISDMILPRLETRKRSPVSAGAGCSSTELGAPLCTPVPVISISRAIVVWRAPMNRFDIVAPSLDPLLGSGSVYPQTSLNPPGLDRPLSVFLDLVLGPAGSESIKHVHTTITWPFESRQITVSFFVLRICYGRTQTA